jgi:hypothetical protein
LPRHPDASQDLPPDLFDLFVAYSERYWFANFKGNKGDSHAAMIGFNRAQKARFWKNIYS